MATEKCEFQYGIKSTEKALYGFCRLSEIQRQKSHQTFSSKSCNIVRRQWMELLMMELKPVQMEKHECENRDEPK